MNGCYARVRIIDIAYGIDRDYCYSIPESLRSEIKIGSVVTVPFGNANRHVSAAVVGLDDECDFPRIKPIAGVLHYPFSISGELIRTCAFMSDRFFCTFGSAFRTILPPGINLESETVFSIADGADTTGLNDAAEVLIRFIAAKGTAAERELTAEFGEECKKLLAALTREGTLKKETRVPEKINEKNLYTVCLAISPREAAEAAEAGNGLTERQRELLAFLVDNPAPTLREAEELGGFSASVINGLCKKGFAEKRETTVLRKAYELGDIPEEAPFTLNKGQTEALEGINRLFDTGTAAGALLFGVTGSGKTRVIIEAVRHAVAKGRQAIVLVPEIGLAAQAVRVYAAAFGARLAVVHSMLSAGERIDTYRRICNGDIDVVIGTRSAVFAPLEHLGLIVIDEEQSHTYKSELTPKYSAIDVARFRCSERKALMLLASATPSVESFYKAKKGIYSLFTLKERFGAAELPQVIIEDMRDDDTVLFTEKLIGRRLAQEIRKTRSEGGQSLLYIGRRGYNSHVSCRDCGYVFTCPNCSVSLTHHAYAGSIRGVRRLSCHYCGFSAAIPESCPVCGGSHIGYSGFGTQRLQDELARDFPEMHVTRMDSDTTGGKFSHDRLIGEFASGKSDILIGTQMISKGLDFPGVRLASAVVVDSGLYADDFRAGERTFSLITQLVGRAGRAGGRGKAILQTFNPDNETLKLAAKQDYESFFESEIILRKAVVFPPFCSMAVFTFSSVSETECADYALRFDTDLLALHGSEYPDVKIIKFGPFRNGIYKVMGRYRQRIILKYKDNARTREFLSKLYCKATGEAPKSVRTELDANPTVV